MHCIIVVRGDLAEGRYNVNVTRSKRLLFCQETGVTETHTLRECLGVVALINTTSSEHVEKTKHAPTLG